MITKPLKVGDYIFQANGALARILRVNKNTYTYETISSNHWCGFSGRVAFNGIKETQWDHEDWFECTEPQAKALESAKRHYDVSEKLKDTKKRIEELLGQAKHFLSQIPEIEIVDPELDDYED